MMQLFVSFNVNLLPIEPWIGHMEVSRVGRKS